MPRHIRQRSGSKISGRAAQQYKPVAMVSESESDTESTEQRPDKKSPRQLCRRRKTDKATVESDEDEFDKEKISQNQARETLSLLHKTTVALSTFENIKLLLDAIPEEDIHKLQNLQQNCKIIANLLP